MKTKKSRELRSAEKTARSFFGAASGSHISSASGRADSRVLLATVAAVLAFLLMANSAWGQASTSVRGTVVDPSGKAVVGASVELANSESKTERSTTTGEQGEYSFSLCLREPIDLR
jgi:protocatechuate 3,4-dioxygenase beta subunit